jgi:hypothetical protein
MKNLFLWMLPALLVSGCGRNPADPGYTLGLPDLPPAWTELLGSPQWRIEWISPEGRRESRVTAGSIDVTLLQDWASPVAAWPFWPDKGIAPGIFRPAGALFPFDAAGAAVNLSWRGGVDAFLYWELASACAAGTGTEAALRQPWNFNWPRFRELFEDPALSEKLSGDPWTVDWKTAAAKIVSSGFDKRRIVPETREEAAIPVPPGPWIGVSPFAPPFFFSEGERPVFPAGAQPGSWFSPAGILRCTSDAWILIPWE